MLGHDADTPLRHCVYAILHCRHAMLPLMPPYAPCCFFFLSHAAFRHYAVDASLPFHTMRYGFADDIDAAYAAALMPLPLRADCLILLIWL